ncbi:MAG: alpha/beta hydrolase [Candidatus Aminicenantes bacterium]|nr:MAG: alpha/beta hydrolase [Candidatus Aminicenantes bacterium]
MKNLRDDNILLLPDGRQLGYAEYGDPKGKTIFEFHGNPSSRLGSILFDEAARRLGVRIIGIDRPGMGLSDYKHGRKLLEWPDDVIELANALDIDRFPIVGGSGGVPSVLACACKIPERLTSVGILFGPRPLGASGATAGWSRSRRIQVFLGRNGPIWIGSLAMKAVARVMRRNPDRALSKMFKELPEPDKEAFNQPGVKQQYINTIQEAFRSGTRGVALDYALNMKPWGFSLEDIQIQVYLWHGEDDTVVPPAMGRYLAQAIPNCQARFIPGEGHFSLLPNHVEEILNTLET